MADKRRLVSLAYIVHTETGTEAWPAVMTAI